MWALVSRLPNVFCSSPTSRLVLVKAIGACQRQGKNVNTVPEDSGGPVMRVLNVAEKNDAAKNLAKFMSNSRSRLREGFSKFNKIYEWNSTLMGQACLMTMTSVSGHLLAQDFGPEYKSWTNVSPLTLFDAPVRTFCPPDFQNIKRTLEREARQCDTLVIWTDCDREGENIGFEVIDVCKAVNPRLMVYRATFSEITATSVARALRELGPPNKAVSDAVAVRQELDLRIGAAFTRFQTLRLQNRFPDLFRDQQVISYGSCQFPTLGFVVERYKANMAHIPEAHWRLLALDTRGALVVELRWQRGRLFDRNVVQGYLDSCLEQPLAKVLQVRSKPKSKWRPLPLDTVEMEKLSSRKLRMGAKEAMRIAEKLYSQGLISYPRTETNIFPPSLDLVSLIREQANDRAWGPFAAALAQRGATPRAGRKSDQAHPPIHPIKYSAALQGNEQTLYEFVVRHFLACCSEDAKGTETTVDVDIAGEAFTATGLVILERNYLDVYPYDRWVGKEIHDYHEGETFTHAEVSIVEGQTSPPSLLTEADLIALMEKHGIGTDATHAEHIEKIKFRCYVTQMGNVFVPERLGMVLVDGYDAMRLLAHGDSFSQPRLRAELEAGLVAVCQGQARPADVLAAQTAKYKAAFRAAIERAAEIDHAVLKYMRGEQQPDDANPPGRGGGGGDGPPDNPPGGGGNPPQLPTPPPAPDSAPDFHFPRCHCKVPSRELTVRKEGPNLGRLFFKCAAGTCDFFLWRDEAPGLPAPIARNVAPALRNRVPPPRGGDQDETLCLCGVRARAGVTMKAGPNQGRPFIACAGQPPSRCTFFQWNDAEPAMNGPQGVRQKAVPGDAGPRRKRRCGICQQEGHTRNKCPRQ